jgi:hypothetical protein
LVFGIAGCSFPKLVPSCNNLFTRLWDSAIELIVADSILSLVLSGLSVSSPECGWCSPQRSGMRNASTAQQNGGINRRGQPGISQFEPLGEPKQCLRKNIQPFFV